MRRHYWARLLFLSALIVNQLHAAENAADLTLVYPCKLSTVPIVIDGKLDPAEWSNAVEVSGFTISGNDTLAPEQTSMRLSYDRDNLYLAITCLESNMKGLKTECTQKDGTFWLDDSIEFFLNPSHDHAAYWQFAATAKGISYDNCQGDDLWNADWQIAAVRKADQWTVEAALPFAALGLKAPEPGTLWGFNLCRERQAGGKLDLYNWSDVQRAFNTVTRFGHLAFVSGDWPATETSVAAAVRDAGGKESRLFVPDGWWRTPAGKKPECQAYIALLRDEDRASPPRRLAELKAIYAANPQMPIDSEYQQLDAAYAKFKEVIEAGAPLDAKNWTRHKIFLDGFQAKLDTVYWRVKVAILNEKM